MIYYWRIDLWIIITYMLLDLNLKVWLLFSIDFFIILKIIDLMMLMNEYEYYENKRWKNHIL